MKPKGQRTSVLIVDDDTRLREMLSETLKNLGYQVSIADSGFKALRYAQTELPDLILLDVLLPDIDGLQVVKRLRSMKETQSIPILMLTAPASKSQIVSTAGEEYLAKPFNTAELTARIQKVLKTPEARHQRLSNAIKLLDQMHSAANSGDSKQYHHLAGEYLGPEEAEHLAASASGNRCRCILKDNGAEQEHPAATKDECAKVARLYGYQWDWTCD